MDYRKLIKFGNSSHVVSMPNEWIRKNNLKKGDIIYTSVNGNNELVLSPQVNEAFKPPQESIISTDNKSSEQIKREIIAAYINSYNTIIISGNNLTEKNKFIREVLNDLVAIEIIEQTQTRLIAKDFLNVKETSIKDLLRKIDIIIRSMITDSLLRLDKVNYESLMNRDLDVNRLCFLAMRIIKRSFKDPELKKHLDVDYHELSDSIRLVNLMEKIADEVKRIARLNKENKIPKKNIEELNKIYNKVIEDYLKVMKAYHSKEVSKAYEVSENHRGLFKLCNDYTDKNSDFVIEKIIDQIKKIESCNVDMARIIYMNLDNNTINK